MVQICFKLNTCFLIEIIIRTFLTYVICTLYLLFYSIYYICTVRPTKGRYYLLQMFLFTNKLLITLLYNGRVSLSFAYARIDNETGLAVTLYAVLVGNYGFFFFIYIQCVMNMPEEDPRRIESIRKYSAIYGRFDCKRKPEKPLTLHEVNIIIRNRSGRTIAQTT